MRMRRKKHLDDRLDDAKSVMLELQCRNKDWDKPLDEALFFDVERVFGNHNPVHLEIGCGKGGFAIQAAKQYPNINFIAVEKNANVLITAAEYLLENPLPNLKLVIGEAESLLHLFKANAVERIYLNFSCPYFKKTYFKNRLTHERFLKIYQEILVSNGEIHMKTDNQNLFEFSIEHLSHANFALKNISLDLHKSDFADNIMTEYEQKFVEMGLPIYRLEAVNRNS